MDRCDTWWKECKTNFLYSIFTIFKPNINTGYQHYFIGKLAPNRRSTIYIACYPIAFWHQSELTPKSAFHSIREISISPPIFFYIPTYNTISIRCNLFRKFTGAIYLHWCIIRDRSETLYIFPSECDCPLHTSINSRTSLFLPELYITILSRLFNGRTKCKLVLMQLQI